MSATRSPLPARSVAHGAPGARSFRHLLAGPGLALVLILGAAACTGRPSVPSSYGDPGSSVETKFIEGCMFPDGPGSTESDLAVSEDVCKCTFDAIREEIPFEDFKALNSEMSDNTAPLPPEMLALLDGCMSPEAEGEAGS